MTRQARASVFLIGFFSWLAGPSSRKIKSVDGDVRQFQTLTVKEESPRLLMLLENQE
jgi:hypothetical protein